MNYAGMRSTLLTIFKDAGFQEAAAQGQCLTQHHEVQRLANGTVFEIWFPGMKTNVLAGKYDYRVNIVKDGADIALSHVNIILDIYNKVCKARDLPRQFRALLANLVQAGDVDPFGGEAAPLNAYQPSEPPSEQSKASVAQVYQAMGKRYAPEGNKWDLTILELVTAIRWIVLQEDMNYPIAARKQGRKMPFKRYWESVACAERGQGIEEVVQRALNEGGRPPADWRGLDYGPINHVMA